MHLVDLAEFCFLTILMHLSRHLAIYNIVHALLKDKKNSLITFLCVVGLGMLWSFVSVSYLSSVNEIILLLASIAICSIPIIFVCKGSVFEKFLAILFSFAANYLTTIIITPVMLAVGVPYSYFVSTKVPDSFVISASILTFSFSFIYAFLLKLVKTKFFKKISIKSTKSYFFLIVPLLNIVYFVSYVAISQVLGNDLINSPAYSRIRVITMVFSGICFVASIFVLFLVDYLEKVEQKNIDSEKQILANTMTFQQTLMLNEEKKELRKIKHDINNLLTTVTGFIRLDKTDKALEILDKTSESTFELTQNNVCSNDLINTIIFIKTQESKKNTVVLKITVEENSAVKISDYDLCRLMHNLIDNSINAAKFSSEKESEIIIEIEPETISILTKNSFDKNHKPKSRDKNHGYGTSIIKEICKKYKGNYTVEIYDNFYNTKSILNNTSI